MCVMHLSAVRGFAIRRREPDPRIDDVRHSEPRQNPQRARNACHRHRRRRAVSVGKPSGRADFRGHDRGRRRRHRRPAARRAADPDPDRAGAARDLAGLAGVVATAAAHQCLSADHWAVGRGDLLLDLRQQPLSAAHPRLGPDFGAPGGKTMRVIILTAALPLVLALTGIAPSSPPAAAGAIASPLELTELIAASLAAALLLRLIKFPASWMFGAMIGESVLNGTGWIEGGLPAWVRGVALVGIGALIGARFARMKVKTLLGHVNAALGSFAIAIVISAIFVAVILLTTHVRFADIVVSFAPGAMDAMLALALTLHIDPIFVGAHHLSRFVFVTIATPGIVHLFGRPQEDVDD